MDTLLSEEDGDSESVHAELSTKNALLPPVAFSTYTVLATDELEGGG